MSVWIAVEARDRLAPRAAYEIPEGLTCGGFPIRGKGIGLRHNSHQSADVMSVFLKLCDNRRGAKCMLAKFQHNNPLVLPNKAPNSRLKH